MKLSIMIYTHENLKKKLEKYLTLQDIILENKSQRTRLTEQTVSTSQYPISLQEQKETV